MFIETDVSKAASVEALVMSDVKRFRKINAAFNNTGVLPPTAPLAEQSETDFDRGLNVDLKGVFLCRKFHIQAMLQTGGGAIVSLCRRCACGSWHGALCGGQAWRGRLKSCSLHWITPVRELGAKPWFPA